jgi:hypothetical protein
MSPIRTGLTASVLSLTLAVSGSLGSAAAQSPGAATGNAYGGLRGLQSAWLRVSPSRSLILALELPFPVARERCSNNRGYFGWVLTGVENFEPIYIRRNGTFNGTAKSRYTDLGSRFEERAVVRGTITPARASGTVQGTVRIVRPSGLVVRCTFGPQHWTLFN